MRVRRVSRMNIRTGIPLRAATVIFYIHICFLHESPNRGRRYRIDLYSAYHTRRIHTVLLLLNGPRVETTDTNGSPPIPDVQSYTPVEILLSDRTTRTRILICDRVQLKNVVGASSNNSNLFLTRPHNFSCSLWSFRTYVTGGRRCVFFRRLKVDLHEESGFSYAKPKRTSVRETRTRLSNTIFSFR